MLALAATHAATSRRARLLLPISDFLHRMTEWATTKMFRP